ncbi:MAG: sulfatase [Phycisphaerae bacterium]|nr:sulfatase [Phycisphaerae bacterium]
MFCNRLYELSNCCGSRSQLRFILLSLLIITHFSSGPAFSENGPEKPNVILIVADDLGYGDLGLHGSKQIPTPYIDRLAAEGIVFTNGYVSSPVCSPSRAGLLTGKNQVSFGFDNNLFRAQPGFDPEYVGLPLSEPTLAETLKSLGYVNGLIGKWHLGEKPQFNPLKRGFDEFWGFLGGGHDYFSARPGGQGMKCPIECNYKTPGDLTYMTDDIGDECVDFIRRHKNAPFFLFASFNAPHSPIQAMEKDLKLFRHIEDQLRRTYCAMVYRLDQNVGKILKALEEEGLERNTFVVFISDNGGPANSISNGSVNAPLRGQKTTLLEGGIRVPYIFKWPQRLKAGQRIDDLVLSLDICPTFIEAAGGMVSPKDNYRGVNIIPFLTGQTEKVPHQSMEWKYTVSTAIRDGDWKLIRLPDRLPMLYHLSEDISEQHDVALENPDRTKAMLKRLGTWDVHLRHPLFLEPANWRIRHLGFYDAHYSLVQPE